jgi:hypothetical protein
MRPIISPPHPEIAQLGLSPYSFIYVETRAFKGEIKEMGESDVHDSTFKPLISGTVFKVLEKTTSIRSYSNCATMTSAAATTAQRSTSNDSDLIASLHALQANLNSRKLVRSFNYPAPADPSKSAAGR